MVSDLVVALGQATVDGHTLFGTNRSVSSRGGLTLCLNVGREFTLGETVRTRYIELPQARHTYTVIGGRSAGAWGYVHGVNEHGVAAACSSYRNKLRLEKPGLTGPDLVRLVLERSHNVCQALDILAELLHSHGQGAFPGCLPEDECDHVFLLADSIEAYAVDTAANHWVSQNIREVRAASDVCTIRQDWNRIAPGLASFTIDKGWWPADGSKLDFATALSDLPTGEASALRRWGRATLLLEQQNGAIDAPFLRRLLGDHYEGTHYEIDPFDRAGGPLPLCQHARSGSAELSTAASLVADLGRDLECLPSLGYAFGPPCLNVYLPLCLEGDLPEAVTQGSATHGSTLGVRLRRLEDHLCTRPAALSQASAQFAELQVNFDREGEDFAHEGAALKRQGDTTTLKRLATSFMQHALEQFDATLAALEVGLEASTMESIGYASRR